MTIEESSVLLIMVFSYFCRRRPSRSRQKYQAGDSWALLFGEGGRWIVIAKIIVVYKMTLARPFQGLRTVLVPPTTMSKFLSVARSNTDRNVETCAILCGKLASDRFSITHVLVPKQTGTSDSCTMLEDDLAPFEYMDQHELITLGWVRRSAHIRY